MKIKNIEVLNWQAPGDLWWKTVADSPDEELIEAVITFNLSHRDYRNLLALDKASRSVMPPATAATS